MPALDLFTIISMGMCTVDPASEIENNFYDLWWGPAPAHKQGDPDFRNKEYKDVDEFPAPCAFDPNGVIDSNEKIAHLLSSSIWDEDPAGYYGDGDDVDFYIHFNMSTSDEEDEFEEDDVPVAHESYLNDKNDVIDFDTTLELLPSNIGSRKAAQTTQYCLCGLCCAFVL